jgi:uncharacterized metal-binding protein
MKDRLPSVKSVILNERRLEMADINCAKCPIVQKACSTEGGKGPKGCPTVNGRELMRSVLERYDEPQIKEFARQASIQEGECYADRGKKPFVLRPTKSRIEEIIEFANKMGYKTLGIAFCGGVTHEAALLTEVLEKHDFDVVAVSCKVGGIPKERIGIQEQEKILIGKFETMCNPIGQAEVLNAAGTDFNIMLCLCVGHDALFLQHIKQPTTVLAAKDRVTGHNPLAPLYTSNSYYQRLKKLEPGSEEEIRARSVAHVKKTKR